MCKGGRGEEGGYGGDEGQRAQDVMARPGGRYVHRERPRSRCLAQLERILHHAFPR